MKLPQREPCEECDGGGQLPDEGTCINCAGSGKFCVDCKLPDHYCECEPEDDDED